MKQEWYESFFTPLALDFWRAAVPPVATAEEVDFIVRNLAVSPPARLLDLPSGLGRHALELSNRGYRVTGIDIAQSGVAAAQDEARARGLTARFIQGDMRHRLDENAFDAAYCFGNSFGYLSHPETVLFIRGVLQAVRPGGRWAIDTGMAAESLLPHLVNERRMEVGGVTYSVRNAYDPLAGRLNQSCAFARGTESQTAQISIGVYTVAELRRMLEGEGWQAIGAYGSLDGRPFELGDRRLLLIAQRR